MLVKLAAIFFKAADPGEQLRAGEVLRYLPVPGVSKKLDSSIGMSGAVIFVMLVATAVTFPIQIFVLEPR